MHFVLLPTQFAIYLPNLEGQGEMGRCEQRRDMDAYGRENFLADGLLLLGGPADSEAKRHVDETILRQQIGDGVGVRAERSHAHCAELEEASLEDRIMDDSGERLEVTLAFEIRGVLEPEMRHTLPLRRQQLINTLIKVRRLSRG